MAAELPKIHFAAEFQVGAQLVPDAFSLWPKQARHARSTARFVCFGGARGPGKTYSLAQKAKSRMLDWPGLPVLILRKDLRDLKRTTMAAFLAVTPSEFYSPRNGGQFNKAENWVRFFNGSTAYFGEVKDWESYKSMNLGYIQIDEASEVDEEAFINLIPTLRWTSGEGTCDLASCRNLGDFAREHPRHPSYQIDLCTNPSPGWIKHRFWEPYNTGHELPQHEFIPATAFDNPSLPPNFIPDLLAHNTPKWVQNYVYGDWSAFENMVWPTFSRLTHLWKGPVPHESFVNVEGGIDYGGTTADAHRTCAYLTGELPDGRYLTFWEYSKQGAATATFFDEVAKATFEYRVHGWDADSSQQRANELLRRQGVPVFDSDRTSGSVKDGINQVHRMFELDASGRPRLAIAPACVRLINAIETYQLDPMTGLPSKNQSDDEDDAFRYNVMRVTKLRAATANRPLAVSSAAGTPKAIKPSEAIDHIRRQRTARRRAILAQIPPDSPFR